MSRLCISLCLLGMTAVAQAAEPPPPTPGPSAPPAVTAPAGPLEDRSAAPATPAGPPGVSAPLAAPPPGAAPPADAIPSAGAALPADAAPTSSQPRTEPAPATEAQPVPADADTGNLTLKESIERGIRLFQQGDYSGAVQAFTAAYVISPKPMLLFNIAQAHRKAGRAQEALTSYQLFLRKAPDTPLRAETEAYIELSRAQLKAQPADPPEPPPAPLVLTAPPPPPPAPRVPVYKRGWFWGVVGAAVATAGGIALGVYLANRPPDTTLGTVDPTF